MADLGQNGFDATQVDPSAGFTPVPAGDYVTQITSSEMKDTKDGKGKYLELTFTVIDGEEKDRTVKARLNLHNQNQVAVEIAQSELSAICHAVNVLQVKDSMDLHGIPLVINVAVVPRNDKPGEFSNDIKSYHSTDEKREKKTDGGNGSSPWKK